MRGESTELRENMGISRQLTKSTNTPLELSKRNEQMSLRETLYTLDNQHSFDLLKGQESLSQDLLCQRALLAHQLNQHDHCIDFAKKALFSLPRCRSCLEVYLSHVEHIPSEQLPLSQQLLLAIEQFGGQLTCSLPKLLQRSPNCSRYFNLVQTLKNQGCIINKIAILEAKSYRKMIATHQIHKNQQLLFVPQSQLITLELCRQLPEIQKLLANKLSLKSPKHTMLAIFLLTHFQKGADSPFYRYLCTLPTDFSSFPFNYSEQLLKELKGTSFLDLLEHKKTDMRKDYEVLLGIDQSFGRFGFDKFCEARMLVSSRVFGIVIQQVKTDALVPMADMLNHRLPKQTSWYYDDLLGGFVVESTREIAQGVQVFDSYGQKCNSRFLLSYGFVQPNNTHNEVLIDVNIVEPYQRSPKTAKIRIGRFLDSRGFQQLLGLLRATVDPESFKRQETQQQVPVGVQFLKQTPFKSKENEAMVWRTVQSIMTEKLRQYPTTLAQDKRLLAESKDFSLSNVIILRRGQKQILSFYQTMSRVMVRVMNEEGRTGDLLSYRTYLESIGQWKEE